MKKISTIFRWIFSCFCFISVFVYGLSISSFLILGAGFLTMPIPFVRKMLVKLKIKKGIAIALTVVLFLSGVIMSPKTETETPDSNEPKVESNIAETKEDEDDKVEEQKVEKGEESNDSQEDMFSEQSVDVSHSTGNNSVGTGAANPVQLSNIPTYNGSPYVVINDNVPDFSSSELTTTGYEKYSSLDSRGRCGVAIASCGKEIMPKDGEERGSISSIKPSGWVQAKYDGISGGYLWNRCHLIGWQLSAENANKQNLITGTRYMNVDGMLPFENMVADYIKETNNHVAYRITPIYDGDNLVCSGVQMEAYSIEDSGDGICFNVFCYNVQPGIVINYATGSSSQEGGNVNNSTTNNSATNNTTTNATTNNTTMVWIAASGNKYHSKNNCGSMVPENAREMTKIKAEEDGYTACKKCYKK